MALAAESFAGLELRWRNSKDNKTLTKLTKTKMMMMKKK
jgi:hypothetical protein